jgi:dienelactone hydrolase
MKRIAFIILVLSSLLAQGQTAPLQRRGVTGFTLHKSAGEPGAVISGISDGGPAQKAGLKKGDQVVLINKMPIPDSYTLMKMLRTIKAGVSVSISYRRNGGALTQVQFTPTPRPPETHTTLQLEPVDLLNDYNDRLRAFVTKPKDARGKLPAILFVSWLSCGSVELGGDTWSMMLRDVAEKTGCLMMRVEKPGVGDSEGVACSDCDLTRELAGYQAALRHLRSRPDVDTTKIILFGGSLGGTLTSVVGKGHTIKAYVTAVSVYKTWLEHMIEHERRRMTLSGTAPGEVSEMMKGFVSFHNQYLREGKTPGEVLNAQQDLRPLWYDEAGHQYERPAAFYHQVNDLNFMKAWSEVKAPVLIVAGEYDWIMSPDDNYLLHELLTKNGGRSTLHVGQGMDHHWAKYKSPVDAFNETNGVYAKETVDFIVEWIKQQVR